MPHNKSQRYFLTKTFLLVIALLLLFGIPQNTQLETLDFSTSSAKTAAPINNSQSILPFEKNHPVFFEIFRTTLYIILFILLIYCVRHYIFTINRLFLTQTNPYVPIVYADWPSVSVVVTAHNEEAVIGDLIKALMQVKYPMDRLQIVIVNDRSTDNTKQIIDNLTQHDQRFIRFHRSEGTPGKAAALKDASTLIKNEIIVYFDADYIPGRYILQQLVAPFFDPEVGAVMGRVIPINVTDNLLTRLLDLERTGGYQVDQQARMQLGLVAQYGGTAGGIRRSALVAVGGWRDDTLAEDTEITYRLLCNGWKTAYQNHAECYEEAPESWAVRIKQIMRWAKGHNQVAFEYALPLLRNSQLSWIARVDGLLLLGIFLVSPLLILAWLLFIIGYYLNIVIWPNSILVILAVLSCSSVGNFAAFFEIAIGVYLDESSKKCNRLRLLPAGYLNFFISAISLSRALFSQLIDKLLKRELQWDKTLRYRKPNNKDTVQ